MRDFKGHYTENSFSFGKLLFLTLTNSNSKVYYAIALKFLAKQINLITKKSVSAICEIMNTNVDFRIFVNTSHSVFLKKKTKTPIKLESKNYFENRGHTFVKNTLGMWRNSEKNINVWWSWSSWKFFLGLKTTWLLGTCILWILNNPRFNNWFKGERDRKKLVIFAK